MNKNANAVVYIPYGRSLTMAPAKRASSTAPNLGYADLIFGERQPEGIIQKEQTPASWSDAAQWKDLAGDQGAATTSVCWFRR